MLLLLNNRYCRPSGHNYIIYNTNNFNFKAVRIRFIDNNIEIVIII